MSNPRRRIEAVLRIGADSWDALEGGRGYGDHAASCVIGIGQDLARDQVLSYARERKLPRKERRAMERRQRKQKRKERDDA